MLIAKGSVYVCNNCGWEVEFGKDVDVEAWEEEPRCFCGGHMERDNP